MSGVAGTGAMTGDPCSMTAVALVEAYRAKKLSPVEVARAALARIEKLNPTYNAFCLVDGERALTDARASEARWAKGTPAGPVDGVPATIKDLMLSKGWPTLRGSRTVERNQRWDEDSPAVARLRENGAVFLGKTTTPEYGWKGVTDSPLTGSTRNPWNPARCSGGSSGGAAVAAALGMGTLNIGSDGGGSIRMPAGFCGIFGFKPTFGVVPAYPSSAMVTLSHVGPMTRTVGDAALMLGVIAKPDARDWYAGPGLGIDYQAGLEGGISGVKIAYSARLGYAAVDRDIARIIAQAARRLEALGAIVEEVDPGFDSPEDLLALIWEIGMAVLVESTPAEKRSLMDPPMLELAERGRGYSAVELRKAEQRREALGRQMNLFHTRYDLLLTPQLPLTAFDSGLEYPPNRGFSRWWQWSPFTYPFNLTQQPAATVPCGFAGDGLPVCLQLVGTKFADELVLRAARAFEAAHPFAMPAAGAA